MRTTTRNSLAVVAAAMATALVGWGIIRLLSVDLTLKESAAMSQVGPVDVLLASLVAGLAAWAVYALLARLGHARWWPFVASTALAVSITGPSYLADGISAVALICLHVVVGVVLILGFTRFVPRPGEGRAGEWRIGSPARGAGYWGHGSSGDAAGGPDAGQAGR